VPQATTSLNVLPFHAWGLGQGRPLHIAGPCSAESPEQLLAAARPLAAQGHVHVFRAGIWKPRTRPGGFEGAGVVALEWLRHVREETGLPVMTEVATARHVEACLEADIDMLWIGARTTPNPFSVQEIADALRGVDIPVFVKNPVNPDLHLWTGALERLSAAGIRRLAAVHRGFNWFEHTHLRNAPMWEFPIRLMAAHPELEVVCDPSHIAGDPVHLRAVAQRAMELGMGGLMVEVHADPANAWSDARQQITPEEHEALVRDLTCRTAHPPPELDAHLAELRAEIDRIDERIARELGERMAVAARIGAHKRAHRVAIVQPERWEAILERLLNMAPELGLGERFVREFMDCVHRESIRKQTSGPDTAEGSPSSGSNGHRQPGRIP
jgi:chorismate mutase